MPLERLLHHRMKHLFERELSGALQVRAFFAPFGDDTLVVVCEQADGLGAADVDAKDRHYRYITFMIVLSGADLVLPGGVQSGGTLVIEGDRIVDIRAGSSASARVIELVARAHHRFPVSSTCTSMGSRASTRSTGVMPLTALRSDCRSSASRRSVRRQWRAPRPALREVLQKRRRAASGVDCLGRTRAARSSGKQFINPEY